MAATRTNQYVIGNIIRLRAAFTDSGHTPVNPTTVTLRIEKPDATEDTPTPTNAGSGVYIHDYQPPSVAGSKGIYSYRFEGTGVVQAACEGQFEMVESYVLG